MTHPGPPPAPRHSFQLALSSSVGAEQAAERGGRLAKFLTATMGRRVEVSVASSYEALAKDLLAGRVDAAWAPPFVCARVESMGVRVMVRGIRQGASTYRAALICRAATPVSLSSLSGATALWVDRDAVAGYLLPIAFLRGQGMDPTKLFYAQSFAGSYRAALDGVLEGRADLTSVFAPTALSASRADQTGVEEIAPDRIRDIRVIAFTEEAPNDGVALSMSAPLDTAQALEKTLLGLHESPEGVALLRDIFNAERFETAPRLGYRALYRVALASL